MREAVRPGGTSSRAVRWAAGVAVLGTVLYTAVDAIAQLLPPHYSPISQAESDLGVGPYGWIMDLNFVLRGVLTLALVYAILRAWPSPDRPRAGLALVTAWGIGAFILAVSPADVSGPATLHGTIHDLTAFLAFLFVAVGAPLVSFAMREEPPWDSIGRTARPISILAFAALLALSVGTVVHRIEVHYFGLLERIFIGSALLWIFVVALGLLRGAARPPPAGPDALGWAKSATGAGAEPGASEGP